MKQASIAVLLSLVLCVGVVAPAVAAQTETVTNTYCAVKSPTPTTSPKLPATTKQDWLFAKGNKIVDAQGDEVWITGLNWFGYNTGTNTFDGLWSVNLQTTVSAVANHGFNLIRVPISVALLQQWSKGTYPKANVNLWVNPTLQDKTSLQIFDVFLAACEQNGVKVMLDIHSAQTDPMGHMKPLWYDGNITAEDYYSALVWVAKRYQNNDTIIALDLKNEPHGKPDEAQRALWNGSKDPMNWKYVAETAASRVLAAHPNILIVVEGVEIYPKNPKQSTVSRNAGDYYFSWWGGNLRGVRDFPVKLGVYQDKLVYSPHDYGPSVYQQPWFQKGYTYQTLLRDYWRDSWFFIYENNTAPLLIGEWGGHMTEPNLTWMTHLRTLITTHKLHHTFWCLNPNSGDTGGLLLDDFTTWDAKKYAFVKPALWQQSGKFIGLDADVALGSNGLKRP